MNRRGYAAGTGPQGVINTDGFTDEQKYKYNSFATQEEKQNYYDSIVKAKAENATVATPPAQQTVVATPSKLDPLVSAATSPTVVNGIKAITAPSFGVQAAKGVPVATNATQTLANAGGAKITANAATTVGIKGGTTLATTTGTSLGTKLGSPAAGAAYGVAGELGAQAINAMGTQTGDKSSVYATNMGSTAVKRAGQGAAIGSMFSPVGTAIGAGIGGVAGLVEGYFDGKKQVGKNQQHKQEVNQYNAVSNGGKGVYGMSQDSPTTGYADGTGIQGVMGNGVLGKGEKKLKKPVSIGEQALIGMGIGAPVGLGTGLIVANNHIPTVDGYGRPFQKSLEKTQEMATAKEAQSIRYGLGSALSGAALGAGVGAIRGAYQQHAFKEQQKKYHNAAVIAREIRMAEMAKKPMLQQNPLIQQNQVFPEANMNFQQPNESFIPQNNGLSDWENMKMQQQQQQQQNIVPQLRGGGPVKPRTVGQQAVTGALIGGGAGLSVGGVMGSNIPLDNWDRARGVGPYNIAGGAVTGALTGGLLGAGFGALRGAYQQQQYRKKNLENLQQQGIANEVRNAELAKKPINETPVTDPNFNFPGWTGDWKQNQQNQPIQQDTTTNVAPEQVANFPGWTGDWLKDKNGVTIPPDTTNQWRHQQLFDVPGWSNESVPKRQRVPKKAQGGQINGPGTAKSDSIPMNLAEGSFVVPAENAYLAKQLRKKYL